MEKGGAKDINSQPIHQKTIKQMTYKHIKRYFVSNRNAISNK